MNVNVKLEAKNAIGEKQASIDVMIRVNDVMCFDTQDRIKGLILKMLNSEEIMNMFNLRACDMEYIVGHLVDIREDEFEVNFQIPENIKPNQYAVDGPRPCETPHDTSIKLKIHVHFEKD